MGCEDMHLMSIYPVLLIASLPLLAADTGKVTIYRQTGIAGKLVRFPIICNGLNIAALKNNARYSIELTEGNYALSGTDKRWGAQLHVLSGQEYFLRFEFVQGLLLGRLALTLVPTEQGSYESGHLKVADSKTERGKCGDVP